MERISTIEALEIFGEDAVPVLERKKKSLGEEINLKEEAFEGFTQLYLMEYKMFCKEHDLTLKEIDLLEPLFKVLKHKELTERKNHLDSLKEEYKNIKFAVDSVWRRAGGEEVLDVDHAREYPIENLIKSEIRGNGKIKHTFCPFHKEENPSFCIYTGTNSYYCFSCKRGGDVIELVMELKGLKFKNAVRYLS